MRMPQPGTVEAELFTQFDDLQRALVARPRVIAIEEPYGQETETSQCGSRHCHTLIVSAGRVHQRSGPPRVARGGPARSRPQRTMTVCGDEAIPLAITTSVLGPTGVPGGMVNWVD